MCFEHVNSVTKVLRFAFNAKLEGVIAQCIKYVNIALKAHPKNFSLPNSDSQNVQDLKFG